jgi:hypothetical protein
MSLPTGSVVCRFNTKPMQKQKMLTGSVADPDPDPINKGFLGLLEPDPDPLVRGLDPEPDPSIIKHYL